MADSRRSPRRWSEPVARLSPNDLVQSRFEGATHVGAVLVLDAPPPDLGLARAVVAERIQGVPRLRQRLQPAPPGCGRPVWVDDARFDIRNHVTQVACPPPGDERALLDLAAAMITTPLSKDRPLWAATVVSGLAGGRFALVLRFHHVLADGAGGLTILAHLVDGSPPRPARAFPRPAPSRSQLAADALGSRLRAFGRIPAALGRLGWAVAQLRPSLVTRAPRCGLNQPTGPRRRLAVARTGLATTRAVAHAHGATVNDVVLTAVAGTLHAFLLGRGEVLDRLVVSVPVSGHGLDDRDQLGNKVGAVPVVLPTAGDPIARLEKTAKLTRTVKSGPRAATAAVLEPVFRVLGALGILRWYINRQRRVNTFVTNLRGPRERLAFLGVTVSDVIAVNGIAGNAAVAFGILSYADTLTVTVVADPDRLPEVVDLGARLQCELDQLAEPGWSRRRAPSAA